MATSTPCNRAEQLSRGLVVLLKFYPYADKDAGKRRPAIFVSDPACCRGQRDGHFLFIGSQTPPAHVPTIALKKGSPEADAMRLRFENGKDTAYIHVSRIATISLDQVEGKLGGVPPALMARIDSQLGQFIGLLPRHGPATTAPIPTSKPVPQPAAKPPGT